MNNGSFSALNMIFKQIVNMSKQERLIYSYVISDTIQTIKALNPPHRCGDEKGEFSDEMNEYLLDLFRIKKFIQDKL